MNKKEYAQLERHYSKACKKIGLDPKSWDFKSHTDLKISYDENRTEVDKFIDLNKTVMQKAEEAKPEDIERYEQQITEHVFEQIQENNSKYFKELNDNVDEVIDTLDKPITDAVSKLVRTKLPLVIIEGRTGNGKSNGVDRQIKRENAGDRSNIYTTSLSKAYLYRLAHDNKDGKIIILRDVNMFRKDILDMLKAMTDTNEPRMIYKNTYSKENKDLPDQFQFKGSIILEVNVVPTESEMKPDIDALLSRAVFVPFHLSLSEIKAKMKAIAKGDPEKMLVTDELFNMKGIDMNLRTQYHAFKTYEWAKTKESVDWKETLKEELKRLAQPKDYWRIYAMIGQSWTTKASLIRSMVTSEGFGIRTAKRRIQDLISAGILHEQQKQVGLKPLETPMIQH